MRPVCLVTPPSVFLLDERVFMSLGVLRVAAALEASGRTVEMVDLSGVENHLDAVRAHARSSSAQCFGITATTPQLPAASQIARAIRGVRPDARLILGGPHATVVHAAAARETAEGREGRACTALEHLFGIFDVVVAGDGEEAVFLAVGDRPPRLVNADDPRSALFLSGARLERLHRPARHLVDVDSYHYEVDGVPALSLIAQLGCPFDCGFCGGRESPSYRRVRMRPTSDVIAEMRAMHREYGIRGFMFYDDELNVNRRMVELMEAIVALQAEEGASFRLRGFVKSELFTDEQAEVMSMAGFRWILTGFESGAPRILKNINKKASREDNTRCVEIAHRHGLKVKALMSIGHPGESPETVTQTRDWLLENRLDEFDVTIITPYPGSPYYDRARPRPGRPGEWVYTAPSGDRLYSVEIDYTTTADYYKGRPDGGYQAFVHSDAVGAEDLVRLRDEVEREVRRQLGLAYPTAATAIRFEHSMGQGPLPPTLLRSTPHARGAAVPAPWAALHPLSAELPAEHAP